MVCDVYLMMLVKCTVRYFFGNGFRFATLFFFFDLNFNIFFGDFEVGVCKFCLLKIMPVNGLTGIIEKAVDIGIVIVDDVNGAEIVLVDVGIVTVYVRLD